MKISMNVEFGRINPKWAHAYGRGRISIEGWSSERIREAYLNDEIYLPLDSLMEALADEEGAPHGYRDIGPLLIEEDNGR